MSLTISPLILSKTKVIDSGGGGSAPVNTVAPSIPTTLVVGVSFTINAGTWSNSPTNYNYKLYRGVTLINEQNSASTTVNYTPLQADAGNTSNITCVVTATNTAGSANATSNTIAQILTVRTNLFLTASGISDATIRGGLNTFDIGLISNSLDTKMKAVYPFVGGTASTHRWNFMDARDLNAAFRLEFSGTATHNGNGYTPNGTNGFAETYINPSTVFSSNNSLAIGVYLRTITSPSGFYGSGTGITNGVYNIVNFGGSSYNRLANNTTQVVAIGTTAGNFTLSRIVSTEFKYYRNGSVLNTLVSASTGRTANTINIGRTNYGATFEYGGGNYAFMFASDGITDSEVSTLHNLITNLQTTLGRNV